MRIRTIREKFGYTQSYIAYRMGTTQATVARWESGAVSPPARVLPKLAEIFGCTIDELFEKEKEDT